MSDAAAASAPYRPVLNEETMNQKLRTMQYAVRGEVAVRATEIQQELLGGSTKYPFKTITFCNIGNPQSVGQPPLSFCRQVLALCMYPDLLKNPTTRATFPADAVARAERLLAECISVGAYSHSQGVLGIRKSVADFVLRRDGFPADPNNIFLTNGASEGVKLVLNMLITGPKDGIMIPLPQYPLYSASIVQFGGLQVSYPLNESKAWGIGVAELEQVLREARQEGVNVRALVVINPGNPTGQLLGEANMKEIVKFCLKERLVLMADEVYQGNVYVDSKPFVSFKKVVCEMRAPLEVISFHSVSKGMYGECGFRGGYMEAFNCRPEIVQQMYKAVSVSLCPNVIGQIGVELMVNPPKKGEPSYSQFQREYADIFARLKRKAIKVQQALNSLPGMTCNASEGAMYLFPRVRYPPKFMEAARRLDKHPDVVYALELLNHTGICVVPGNGFGQEEGTFHFRTTFLPTEDLIDIMIANMDKFQRDFMARYGGGAASKL